MTRRDYNKATHIQIENETRGQTVPLHKGDIHIKHAPSVKSDLYAKQDIQSMLMNVNVLDDAMTPSPHKRSDYLETQTVTLWKRS